MAVAEDGHTPYFENTFLQLEGRVTRGTESFFTESIADGEIARDLELPRSADILVCEFTGHSCPVFWTADRLGTGKSPEPTGWKACATPQFMESGIVPPKHGLIQ